MYTGTEYFSSATLECVLGYKACLHVGALGSNKVMDGSVVLDILVSDAFPYLNGLEP